MLRHTHVFLLSEGSDICTLKYPLHGLHMGMSQNRGTRDPVNMASDLVPEGMSPERCDVHILLASHTQVMFIRVMRGSPNHRGTFSPPPPPKQKQRKQPGCSSGQVFPAVYDTMPLPGQVVPLDSAPPAKQGAPEPGVWIRVHGKKGHGNVDPGSINP